MWLCELCIISQLRTPILYGVITLYRIAGCEDRNFIKCSIVCTYIQGSLRGGGGQKYISNLKWIVLHVMNIYRALSEIKYKKQLKYVNK